MKRIRLILITFTLTITLTITKNLKAAESAPADTITVLNLDSIIPAETIIDEDLSDLFSVQIDSAYADWILDNVFLSDSMEVKLIDNYPKNIPDSVYIRRLQETEQVIDLSLIHI